MLPPALLAAERSAPGARLTTTNAHGWPESSSRPGKRGVAYWRIPPGLRLPHGERPGETVRLRRRHFLQLAAGATALPILPRSARAHAYPSRPVRMIVAFPAGNAPDIVARLIGQWL